MLKAIQRALGHCDHTMDGLAEELERLGAPVAPQWLAAGAGFLQGAPGLAGAPPAVRAKAVLQQLLAADLNLCGAPALPPGVQVRRGGRPCFALAIHGL